MFCLHWGSGQSLSLKNPARDPYMVVWQIPLGVKVQRATTGSFNPGRRAYLGLQEPERAPPFDIWELWVQKAEWQPAQRLGSQSSCLSSWQILLTLTVEFFKILLAVLMRSWLFVVVVLGTFHCLRPEIPLQGCFLLHRSPASSTLYSRWNLASGVRSNLLLLPRLFQLAFQASGNTGPAFCPEALLSQQRTAAFSLGGNKHLKGNSSEWECFIMKAFWVAPTGSLGAEGLHCKLQILSLCPCPMSSALLSRYPVSFY